MNIWQRENDMNIEKDMGSPSLYFRGRAGTLRAEEINFQGSLIQRLHKKSVEQLRFTPVIESFGISSGALARRTHRGHRLLERALLWAALY